MGPPGQHWHGIFQNGTNYNDGTGSVTQCPIVPGNSYQYDFKIPNQVRVMLSRQTIHFILITRSARLERSGIIRTFQRSTVMA